jgi:hypothetical protein
VKPRATLRLEGLSKLNKFVSWNIITTRVSVLLTIIKSFYEQENVSFFVTKLFDVMDSLLLDLPCKNINNTFNILCYNSKLH